MFATGLNFILPFVLQMTGVIYAMDEPMAFDLGTQTNFSFVNVAVRAIELCLFSHFLSSESCMHFLTNNNSAYSPF